MTDNLVLNTILLRCEVERGSAGLIKFGIRSGVEGEGRLSPIASCTSPRVKGVVLEGVSIYYPGRRRKKNGMMIILTVACMRSALVGG